MAVVNKRTHTPNENTVYIGRGSIWGNPFVMHAESQRDEVCDRHMRHLNQQIKDGVITDEQLASLHGKDLMCFCAPKRCHGHYLEYLAKEAHERLQQAVAEPKPYKMIVAGGRDFNNVEWCRAEMFNLAEQLGEDKQITVISGMARGADMAAYLVCQQENIECIEMPADWKNEGRAAGFIRNRKMGVMGDCLLAFHDGKSRGTQHMIDTMRAMGKPVYVVQY